MSMQTTGSNDSGEPMMDINTQYKCIGAAIVTMQEAGFQRVGFISEPPPGANERL